MIEKVPIKVIKRFIYEEANKRNLFVINLLELPTRSIRHLVLGENIRNPVKYDETSI